ncbi:MAG TPA: hypothetical protein VF469_35330 [Kofleriaceae bacterium]
MKLIADAQVGLTQRLDRMEARFDARFDQLETRVGGLEVFAADAQRRLKRIEGHLQLSGASSRPKARTEVARKRVRKS